MNGFLSYSHEDHRLFMGFRPHLAALRRGFGLDIWTDHNCEVGTLWNTRIEAAIKAAQVFVLLISPDFIASDYVNDNEIPAIREQRRSAGSLVLPVVLRRCSWQMVAASLQAAPTENGRLKPVTDWPRQNDGFDRAREQMMTAIENHFGITRLTGNWGVA
jgi:hypothetical protein